MQILPTNTATLQDDFVPEYTTYLDKAREAKEAKKFRSIMAEEMEGEEKRGVGPPCLSYDYEIEPRFAEVICISNTVAISFHIISLAALILSKTSHTTPQRNGVLHTAVVDPT